MARKWFPLRWLVAVVLLASGSLTPSTSDAASAAEIDKAVDEAIANLHSESADAKALVPEAKGILVIPRLAKAGLIIGAQGGEGALRVNGKTTGYYNSVALSFGLQAGVQWVGYAMYFMNDKALSYLNRSGGWEVGTGPTITVWDEGMAGSLTTTSGKSDIYVFFFSQKGLMAGIDLQGTKITKFTPEE